MFKIETMIFVSFVEFAHRIVRARDEFLDLKITSRNIYQEHTFLGENEEIIIARRRFA